MQLQNECPLKCQERGPRKSNHWMENGEPEIFYTNAWLQLV